MMPGMDHASVAELGHAASGNPMMAAVLAAFGTATAFWLAMGATLWRVFFEPRMKKLEEERDQERTRCDLELQARDTRILQLEALLWFHGPQMLRQDMQKALSEEHIEMLQRTGGVVAVGQIPLRASGNGEAK